MTVFFFFFQRFSTNYECIELIWLYSSHSLFFFFFKQSVHTTAQVGSPGFVTPGHLPTSPPLAGVPLQTSGIVHISRINNFLDVIWQL